MKESITLVFKRFLFVFGFYFVLRFIFFTYNIENYRNIDNAEILSAFLLGIRFDISAIIKLNGIFFLIWLMPLRIFNYGIAAKLIRFLFYSVNILFFILNLVDSELINFTGQRLTVNFFTITKDIDNQLSQLIRYYWFIALMCLLFIFVFVKYFPVKKESYLYDTRKTGFYVYVASTLVTIFLFGLGARGGLQNKPLRPAHAFRYSHSELGNLVLNSTFTLLKMSGVGEQKKVIFIDEKEMLANLLRDRKNHFSKWSKHQNVVIFIMESFALEFISGANSENGYTPFFYKLMTKGLFFQNAFANGRRSIEAVPAILSSIPSLLNDAFLTSRFQGAKILGLGEILEKNGYETAFFHGAQNGSMFFDTFSARTGFQHYFGLQEYPDSDRSLDYDGFWGIFDEPFFQFAHKKINEFKKPFAAVIFSLSSHQPYAIPAGHEKKFSKGTLEIHESIGYADYALQKFFESAEKEDWYKDTLFIITADHTQKSDNSNYDNLLGRYRVPLLFFHPSVMIWPKVDTSRVVQHTDILPSVLDVLAADNSALSLVGSSVFANSDDAIVVNRTPEGYWFLSQQYLLQLDYNDNMKAFKHDNTRSLEPVTINKVPDAEILRFKSYLQYFINGVIENKLYIHGQ